MTRVVHMQMKRRGVETRLVIPGEAVAVSRNGPALLRALSRGYQWFGELASGRVVSTRQIAAREGLSHSYVRHVVPLGLLAPKLMEAICTGQQSVTISAERLKDHARLPIEWDAQQRLLADQAAVACASAIAELDLVWFISSWPPNRIPTDKTVRKSAESAVRSVLR